MQRRLSLEVLGGPVSETGRQRYAMGGAAGSSVRRWVESDLALPLPCIPFADHTILSLPGAEERSGGDCNDQTIAATQPMKVQPKKKFKQQIAFALRFPRPSIAGRKYSSAIPLHKRNVDQAIHAFSLLESLRPPLREAIGVFAVFFMEGLSTPHCGF
jgi:hypothetical protein